jgi:hypothetical protein
MLGVLAALLVVNAGCAVEPGGAPDDTAGGGPGETASSTEALAASSPNCATTDGRNPPSYRGIWTGVYGTYSYINPETGCTSIPLGAAITSAQCAAFCRTTCRRSGVLTLSNRLAPVQSCAPAGQRLGTSVCVCTAS